MNPGTASRVLNLVASCVLLAGCGGAALLKEARPLESSKAVATAQDERVFASIDRVILRNGPGAWARDAEWDEYLIRIRAHSGESVEIRQIAIFDALDQGIETRADRSDLVNGTRETERRYAESGRLVRTDGVNGWVAAGVGVAGASTLALAAAPPMLAGGGAVLLVAAPVLLVTGAAFAGAGIVRLVNNAEVNGEIKRRQSTLPLALPGGGEASMDLFFPMTPLSGRARITYADRQGEHRLDIDTRQALIDLDLESNPPPTIVSRSDPYFPDEARREGITGGYVKARLTLDGRGRVQTVDIVDSKPPRVFEREARRNFRDWIYTGSRRDSRTVEATLEFKR